MGGGDAARRTADLLRANVRLYGLTRRPEDIPKLRNHGITPITGDLDRLRSLGRLRLAPFAVLHFAPPPSEGRDDPRTAHLIAALTNARIIPQRFVYISTSGVYGDCSGNRVTESRRRNARPPRVSWDEAETRIAPMLLSFMSESRRLANQRMKSELRVRLKYPTPQALFAEMAPRPLKKQLALALSSRGETVA